jgi:hypothetical protein
MMSHAASSASETQDYVTAMEEDSQQFATPPMQRRASSKGTKQTAHTDTPMPSNASLSEKASSAAPKKRATNEKRTTFAELLEESSDSASEDEYIAASQPRHIIKPPKFNGVGSFETFYAQFQNCSDHNKWNRHDQLYYLKAALTDEAGQVLWDSNPDATNSLSKLVRRAGLTYRPRRPWA